MTMDEKFALLEEIFELDKSELSEDMELPIIASWDSMARLSLIVLLDDEFGLKVSGEKVKSFKTIKDIIQMME